MPINQAADFYLNGKPFLLYRFQPGQGRAWSRTGTPDTPAVARGNATNVGNLSDLEEHPVVYDDFSNDYGYAFRHPERPGTTHWTENMDVRFPNQATHCQAMQLLASRYASTNINCEYLYDVPLPGVNNPPAGAGAVLAIGKGYIASFVPTALNTAGSMFDRLYEATGGGAITFGRRPATFGSFTYIGVLEGSSFIQRGHDGLTYTIGPNQPAQVVLNSGDRLDLFWKGTNGQHIRTVAQGADPLNSANYSATIPVGPGHLPVLDAVDRDSQIFAGMANGLQAGNTTGTFSNVLPDLADQRHADNCRDLCVYLNEIQVPHIGGLWSFHPSTVQATAREVGPSNHGDKSPVHGRARAVQALGPWVYQGQWTGSASYILAGRDQSDGTRVWTVMQRLPHIARISRIHFDGITTSSGGREISQRMWVATDASLTATAPLYVTPIPRGNDNPLAPDPTFTANYCGSARMDFGRDDFGAPATPKIFRQLDVECDLLLSGVRYGDIYYTIDGGQRTYLGRLQDSPRSTLYFPGFNGQFLTGYDVELSLESYTASLNIAPVWRKFILRGPYRPGSIDEISAVVHIADNLRDRHGTPMRPGKVMMDDLRAMAAKGSNPARLLDLTGAANWVLVNPTIGEQEQYQEGSAAPEVGATIRMAILTFTANQGTTWSGADTQTWSAVGTFTWAQIQQQPWT